MLETKIFDVVDQLLVARMDLKLLEKCLLKDIIRVGASDYQKDPKESGQCILSLNLKLLFHLVKAWGSSLSCHLRLFEDIEYEFLNHQLSQAPGGLQSCSLKILSTKSRNESF